MLLLLLLLLLLPLNLAYVCVCVCSCVRACVCCCFRGEHNLRKGPTRKEKSKRKERSDIFITHQFGWDDRRRLGGKAGEVGTEK